MAKVSFVGFQEKVEIPEGFSQLEIEESFDSSRSRDDLFRLISDIAQISMWLGEVTSFDSRPGGKMVFADGTIATCTGFNLGREVSLISDSFGNFTAKVGKSEKGNSLQLNFAILTDGVESKSAEILAILNKLQAQL